MLELYTCTITTATCAALSCCTSLRKIELWHCIFWGVTCRNGCAEDGSLERDFINSMNHENLQSITFCGTDIGKDGFISMKELLRDRRRTLQEIYISSSTDYANSDKFLLDLAPSVAECKALKSLKLGSLLTVGWLSLFSSLMTPGISLCQLVLSSCNISNDAAIQLAKFISSIPSLKTLDLSDGTLNGVSEDTSVAFFSVLLSSNYVLKSLNLSNNIIMPNRTVSAITNTLTQNTL